MSDFEWHSTLEETMVGKLEWDVSDYIQEINKCKKLLDCCKELQDYRIILARIYDLKEELWEFFPQECVELGLRKGTAK